MIGLAAAVLAGSLVVLCALPALAAVSGPCSNCHTMHNSQNGQSMAYDSAGSPDDSANWNLLVTDCVGCHSATDGATWQNPVTGAPVVYNISAPSYGADAGDGQKQGLAAGNFYWVDQDDAFGHNIFSPDPVLTQAPGRQYGCTGDSCHRNLDRPGARGGRMRQGCTKCHTFWDYRHPQPYHHADDSATITDSYLQGWYRFLGSFHAAGRGASGIEDPDWEYTRSSSDHNEYLGVPGDKTSNLGASANGNTVSSFCIGCHNIMHVQDDTATGASPWLRHPSDQTLPADGEFAGYTVYDPQVPVARPVLSEVSAVVTPGTDMVMCLSCHRAHGSPYPDMLRFPYDGMVAGGGGADGTGCFKCHTQKDGS